MVSYTAIVTKEDEMFIAKCPEIGTVSQGKTMKQAIANLKEATELYLTEFPLKKKDKAILTTFDIRSLVSQ